MHECLSFVQSSIQGKIVTAGTSVLERKDYFGELEETRIFKRLWYCVWYFFYSSFQVLKFLQVYSCRWLCRTRQQLYSHYFLQESMSFQTMTLLYYSCILHLKIKQVQYILYTPALVTMDMCLSTWILNNISVYINQIQKVTKQC